MRQYSVKVLPMVGLLENLSFDQQSEMVYIGYFNRAADPGGFAFWAAQNVKAQAAGQSADQAITNIANAFTPQAETLALYPFLANTSFNLANPITVVQVGSLVDSIYGNLFGRTPTANDGGRLYWVNQVLTGAVGIGQSVLDIANGATGNDATVLLNKINIATDFTSRTAAANIGVTTAPASLLSAAKGVLSGTVGAVTAGTDAVSSGLAATTTFIADQSVQALITPTAIDASKQPAGILDFDVTGNSDAVIVHLSNAQHVSDLYGAVNTGFVGVTMAAGSTSFGVDLRSSSTSGAAFAYASTTDSTVHGIQVVGATSIVITSNGPLANTIAGFHSYTGYSIDGETVTVLGSTSLVLGSAYGAWHTFGNVVATGETINASSFTGGLTYTTSGKGDTVLTGSGNDRIYAGANDTITTGAGSDIVTLAVGSFASASASDVAFITDFAAGADKLQIGGGGSSASAVFNDTLSTVPGAAASLAAAGQQAFKDVLGINIEVAKSVVEFTWRGNQYDAISLNGAFASGGYYVNGAVANVIVKVTGTTGTQSTNDFLI